MLITFLTFLVMRTKCATCVLFVLVLMDPYRQTCFSFCYKAKGRGKPTEREEKKKKKRES